MTLLLLEIWGVFVLVFQQFASVQKIRVEVGLVLLEVRYSLLVSLLVLAKDVDLMDMFGGLCSLKSERLDLRLKC